MTLVDTATAAVAAGVTERTIRRWVAAGHLTNHGTSRRVAVDLDSVTAMSAKLCSTGESAPQTPTESA